MTTANWISIGIGIVAVISIVLNVWLARSMGVYRYIKEHLATKEDVVKLSGHVDTKHAELSGHVDTNHAELVGMINLLLAQNNIAIMPLSVNVPVESQRSS